MPGCSTAGLVRDTPEPGWDGISYRVMAARARNAPPRLAVSGRDAARRHWPRALYVNDHAKIVQEVLGTDATGNQGRPIDVTVTAVTGDPRAPASGDYSTMRAPDHGLAASHRAASVDV
jgi:hypothetical protein